LLVHTLYHGHTHTRIRNKGTLNDPAFFFSPLEAQHTDHESVLSLVWCFRIRILFCARSNVFFGPLMTFRVSRLLVLRLPVDNLPRVLLFGHLCFPEAANHLSLNMLSLTFTKRRGKILFFIHKLYLQSACQELIFTVSSSIHVQLHGPLKEILSILQGLKREANVDVHVLKKKSTFIQKPCLRINNPQRI